MYSVTVWANTQNKHASPGICTLSGSSLFRLYRATNNPFYLELIREIAHSLPQYVSRDDRQIGDNALPGWMDERVNLSDWLEGVGETMNGASCWPEVTTMLTCTELPGVYIQPDTPVVCTFDNIDANIMKETEDKLTVELTNPTKFEASVKIFIEKWEETKNVLGQDYMSKSSTIVLAPAGSRILEIAK